jgi:oligoribonuclease
MLILWADVETTGLDPSVHHLLEVATVLTDGKGAALDTRSWVLQYDGASVVAMIQRAAPIVVDMHAKSGLWQALVDPGVSRVTIKTLQQELADVAALFAGERPSLGGFSPHFDARWLRRYVPHFFERLSHRVFDCSTLKQGVKDRYGEWGPAKSDVAHRALPDTRDAIEYWRWYRAHVMIPYAPPGRGAL